MNHRRSEGARGRKTRALTVVSVLLLTPLRNEVPVLLSARRKKERDRSVLRLAPGKEGMYASKIRHGSLVGDDE
uniref:Secreted protein n=1 Tax=Peronospora matthiolae TaxID=2874970 RepID=A0AAV1VJR6_9STRA